MKLSTLFSTCALALTANSFLIPPEVNDLAIEVIEDAKNAFHALTIPSHTVTLNLCKDCTETFLSEGELYTKEHADVKLELDFSTDGFYNLLVNGGRFFPTTEPDILMARKLIRPTGTNEYTIRTDSNYVLSWVLEQPKDFNEEGLHLSAVKLHILAINDKVVTVDDVLITYTAAKDGSTQLLAVNTIAPSQTPEEKECTSVVCRAKALTVSLADRIRTVAIHLFMKAKNGCAKKLGYGPKPPHKGPKGPKVHGGPNKFAGKLPHQGDKDRPEHPHGKGRHGHHHHARIACVFSRILHGVGHFVTGYLVPFLTLFLVPVIIGVTAGMMVSAIGMAIGQVLVYSYVVIRRRRDPNYARVEQEEVAELPPKYDELEPLEVVVSEKSELMKDVE